MSKNEFRTEKDSLGELHVPAKALYGVQTEPRGGKFPHLRTAPMARHLSGRWL